MSQLTGDKRLAGTAFGRPSAAIVLSLFQIADLLLVILSGVIASWYRFGKFEIAGATGLVIVLTSFATLVVFRQAGLYRASILGDPSAQIGRLIFATVCVALIVAMIGYMTKTGHEISRLWAGYWFVLCLSSLVLTRFFTTHLFTSLVRSGAFQQRFVVIGVGNQAARLKKFLKIWEKRKLPGQKITGIFVDHPADGEHLELCSKYPVRVDIANLRKYIQEFEIEEAVVVSSPDNCKTCDRILEQLSSVALDVDLVLTDVDSIWLDRPLNEVAGLPSIRIMSKPLGDWALFQKRLLDIAVSALALIFFGPLMVMIALGIKFTSPGPVFFKQLRHGFNNDTFSVLKFRTMNDEAKPVDGVPQATRQDPRVTPLGRFLRMTSLDELPQLFNVLVGDMSIVGPRPHAVEHNDHYAKRIQSYLERHRIKPGITGWAQIHGLRGETDTIEKMRKRVEYDLYYADNWSLALDLKIMILTLGCFTDKNAY